MIIGTERETFFAANALRRRAVGTSSCLSPRATGTDSRSGSGLHASLAQRQGLAIIGCLGLFTIFLSSPTPATGGAVPTGKAAKYGLAAGDEIEPH
jgi:hypothetical protein